ncbi:MAG TPA: glycosyltransferase family 2 protein [Terriglobales bacterium]|jgi:glycosyltransferase involved in cell wall biosynthesis|nr:glycosyltransferase family 2 protein [Terriglobales bacterium]
MVSTFSLPELRCILPRVTLSVVLITQNEEGNLPRTLESVMPLVRDGKGEIIVVDSGSADRTVEIAQSFGAKVFVEAWKGFAAQKNSAMDKASMDWVLQLDADERLEPELASEIEIALKGSATVGGLTISGFWIPRKNFFLGRWIRHGGFYPDHKLRLIRRGSGRFEEYGAHPTIKVNGPTGKLSHALLHNAYPTLRGYIDHMNSYSSMGAEVAMGKGHRRFSVTNIVIRPLLTFVYNYLIRLGFLDGREGLLLHLYHSAYVSWKYAKAWELSRANIASNVATD